MGPHIRQQNVIAPFHAQLEHPGTVPIGSAAVAMKHNDHRGFILHMVIAAGKGQTIVRLNADRFKGIALNVVHQGKDALCHLLVLLPVGNVSWVLLAAGRRIIGCVKNEGKDQTEKKYQRQNQNYNH